VGGRSSDIKYVGGGVTPSTLKADASAEWLQVHVHIYIYIYIYIYNVNVTDQGWGGGGGVNRVIRTAHSHLNLIGRFALRVGAAGGRKCRVAAGTNV